MHHNLKNYNKDLYNSRIKRSFYSLISVFIGLLFSYLAITNPKAKTKEEVKIEKNQNKKIDNFVSLEEE